MSLMQSGSDSHSEQPTSIRMSRVLPATFVILGLLGSAFVLGRNSVASLAAPTEAVGLAITVGLDTAFGTATAGKPESAMLGICATFKANGAYASADDQAWLNARPRCLGTALGATTAAPVGLAITVGLNTAFSTATAGKPESAMLGICATFKANVAYASAGDQAWLNARPRCQGTVPGYTAATAVTACPTPAGDANAMGAAFSAATAGKSEAGIRAICAQFTTVCTTATDNVNVAWVAARPRCAR
jgi:hypothetical protein